MIRFGRIASMGVAVLVAVSQAQAGTIIKLGLGNDSAPDIMFTGGAGGTLSTMNDGNATTTGDQNTGVEFADFLAGVITDIRPSVASFSLANLTAAGPATTFGPLVIQNFSGGTMNLYDAANSLLLSGTLGNSALTGPIGPPATGGLFTTSFATITGGSLQPRIMPGSLTLSMSLTDINGGAGFSVGGATAPSLNAFTADVTLNIAGEQIPEPLAASLLLIGLAVAGLMGRRR